MLTGTTRPIVAVSLLAGLALIHRLIILAWTSSIATDAEYYLWAAQFFGSDRSFAPGHNLHPLYPALIAAGSRVLGDPVVAGYAISVAAGILTLFPLYYHARSLWSHEVAAWCGFLYALHPILALETSEILSESIHLLLLVSAVYVFSCALRRLSLPLSGLAGLIAGLAYLARPAAITFIVYAGVAAGMVLWSRPPTSTPGRALRVLGCLGLSLVLFVILGAAFAIRTASAGSSWTLSPRTNARVVLRLLDLEGADPRPGLERAALSDPSPAAPSPSPRYRKLLQNWLKAGNGAVLALAALGLVMTSRWGGRWRVLAPEAVLIVALWLAPVLVELLNPPSSHRYFLPGVVFLLPWSGVACAALQMRLSRRSGWSLNRAAVPVAAALGIIFLARSMGPRRPDERVYAEVGRWVREHRSPDREWIMTNSSKLAYYSGALPLALPRSPLEAEKTFRDNHLEFMVVDTKALRHESSAYLGSLSEAGFRSFWPTGSAGMVRALGLDRTCDTGTELVRDRSFAWWSGPAAVDMESLRRTSFSLDCQGRRGRFQASRRDPGPHYAVRFQLEEAPSREAAILQVGFTFDREFPPGTILEFSGELRTNAGAEGEAALFVQHEAPQGWRRSARKSGAEDGGVVRVNHVLDSGSSQALAGVYFEPRRPGDWVEFRRPSCTVRMAGR